MSGLQPICFLSGWAGYRELFPFLGRLPHFYVPFAPHGEQAIRNILLGQDGDQTLVAWSTGAHMVLKWGADIIDRFARVVLVAPFLDFTACLPCRIIRNMQARLEQEGPGVLTAFYANCGVPSDLAVPLEGVHVDQLIRGLAYLVRSRCIPDLLADVQTPIHLVHGSKDRIVPKRAFARVGSLLPRAKVHCFPCGHFVPDHLLTSLVESSIP
ncbi:alpha/beta fold hydrolase [Desulfoplanes formicivorans]|uniref:AB hydrolase-1 domain-containing protein n=1 Tax=Desulfoplanes formicivorans TaxID=1592317 RepID=A0A194AI44_9BACT|nr:alpha/beta hydrolase [Desulfoplanes formicivorans]GAU08998.1 hypothetical protein DPF_1717 [Desulfoplanes formicivorans]